MPPAADLPPPPPPSANLLAANPGATSVDEAAIDTSPEDESSWRDVWLQVPSWLTSMVAHLSLFLLLALLSTAHFIGDGPKNLLVSVDGDASQGGIEELEGQLMGSSDQLEQTPLMSPPDVSDAAQSAALSSTIGLMKSDVPKADLELKPLGGGAGVDGGVGAGGNGQGNGLELRLSASGREGMLRTGGGTPKSEAAVTAALHWLAEHQNYDGSWSYQHQKSPHCHGSCGEPGNTDAKIAATAMALLPFLGTGQTHRDGQYKKNIDLGLKYLIRSMRMQGDMGSLHEPGGTMYGHGLASIALCEAYGMTRDPALQVPAQAAINFIVEAQDPNGGGWRVHAPSARRHVGGGLANDGAEERANRLPARAADHASQGRLLPRLRAKRARCNVRLSRTGTFPPGNHRHRPAVPHVPGLEA